METERVKGSSLARWTTATDVHVPVVKCLSWVCYEIIPLYSLYALKLQRLDNIIKIIVPALVCTLLLSKGRRCDSNVVTFLHSGSDFFYFFLPVDIWGPGRVCPMQARWRLLRCPVWASSSPGDWQRWGTFRTGSFLLKWKQSKHFSSFICSNLAHFDYSCRYFSRI